MADDYRYLDEVDVNGSTFIQFKPISTRTLEDVIKGDQEQQDVEDIKVEVERKTPPPILPKPKRKRPVQSGLTSTQITSSSGDTQTRLQAPETTDTCFDRASVQSGDDDDSGIEGSAYQGSEPPPDDIGERLSHQVSVSSEACLTQGTEVSSGDSRRSQHLPDVIADNQRRSSPQLNEAQKPTESFMAEMCLASTLPLTSKKSYSKRESFGKKTVEADVEASKSTSKRVTRSNSMNAQPYESRVGKSSRCAALVRSIDAILDESLDRLKPAGESSRPTTPNTADLERHQAVGRISSAAPLQRRLSLNQTDRKPVGYLSSPTDRKGSVVMKVFKSPQTVSRSSFSETDCNKPTARFLTSSGASQGSTTLRYKSPRRLSSNEHTATPGCSSPLSLDVDGNTRFVSQLDTTISGRPASRGMARHRSVSPSIMTRNCGPTFRVTTRQSSHHPQPSVRLIDRGETSQNATNEQLEQRSRVVVPTTLLRGRGFSISRDSSGNVCVQSNSQAQRSPQQQHVADGQIPRAQQRVQTPQSGDKPMFVFQIRKPHK